MRQFVARNFRWLAGGVLLTFFSSLGQTYFISGSIAEWQTLFQMSHGQFGRLYMMATLASALMLPFLGRLLDIFAAHHVLAVVIPMLAVAAFLAGSATTIPVLVVAIFLLRLLGQGMMTHIALTATGRWFVAERGRAVSLVVLGHQGGEATFPLLFATLSVAYGYQMGWTVAAIALLVVGLPLAYLTYRVPRVPLGQPSTELSSLPAVRSWSRGEVVCDPVFWVLLTGVLAPPFIGTTIFYHQNYMTTLNNWGPQLFASSLLIMALTTVIFALAAGAVIDRFRATAILPFFLLPLSTACLLLGYSGTPQSLLVVMVLLGVSYGFSSTLFGALWPEIYGVENLGGIRSITVSAAVLATAAGPGVTGTLIDFGFDLPVQLYFLGLYCLLAAIAMTVASRRLKKRID